MQQIALENVAQVSYRGVKIFYPMSDPYDRQMLAEHVAACTGFRSGVEIAIGDRRWVLHRTGSKHLQCPNCGGHLATSCQAPKGKRQVCVRCAIEDSAAGTSSPPVQQLTT